MAKMLTIKRRDRYPVQLCLGKALFLRESGLQLIAIAQEMLYLDLFLDCFVGCCFFFFLRFGDGTNESLLPISRWRYIIGHE